ncbi:MAG: 30S ribosomal protein S13, partial [Candidatus Azambacteria bacterium]|nr:30S ribosomal protein S13 [Candidatus Azambacteria bacterium]
MPRIAGINIPENKKIAVSLSYIYGIGQSKAKKILSDLKIDLNKRASDLTSEEINNLRDSVEKNHKIEGELKRMLQNNIKRLKEIGSYRGYRHGRGLPVRG